jgi:hypothetical protein
METSMKYSVTLSFEEIKLPPFQEILVLGKNSPHGKIGISKSFELLVPNGFEIIEIEDEKVEALFINKRILAKMPKEKIIKILKEKVFQFVSEGEILKVDFKVTISYSTIEQE